MVNEKGFRNDTNVPRTLAPQNTKRLDVEEALWLEGKQSMETRQSQGLFVALLSFPRTVLTAHFTVASSSIAALITQGDAEPQLRRHTRWAIDHGSTREELEALGTLLAVYAGFPRAVNGLMAIREELDRVDEAR
jgi:hypothetical protein